ncbi:hypothetical protein NX023_11100 [Cytobacillus firmus]|nr:hypothetical protein [Cytobacillus firmus]
MSPKSEHLRTEEARFRGVESEVESPSDRKSKNPRELVRTRPIFGQDKDISEE